MDHFRGYFQGFLSAKEVPLTRIVDGTAYGEIRTKCPLRGSGDIDACWRMMAYDRRIVERSGGQFMVLRSQAQPGIEVCEVAIRWSDRRDDQASG